MIESALIMSDVERNFLEGLLGSTLVSLSGERMESADFSWGHVAIETSSHVIELRLDLEVRDIDGLEDEFPILRAGQLEKVPVKATRAGNVFFHHKGQQLEGVFLVRDTVVGTRDSQEDFTAVADIGILLELESGWLSICRASHFVEAFRIQHAPTISQLNFPDTADEWEETLVDHYALTRQFLSAANAWNPAELA